MFNYKIPKGQEFKGIKILDSLAATGLRSIRYTKEISSDLIKSITLCDISTDSVNLIKKNLHLNKINQQNINGKQYVGIDGK